MNSAQLARRRLMSILSLKNIKPLFLASWPVNSGLEPVCTYHWVRQLEQIRLATPESTCLVYIAWSSSISFSFIIRGLPPKSAVLSPVTQGNERRH